MATLFWHPNKTDMKLDILHSNNQALPTDDTIYQLQDVLYGLEHFSELRPSTNRITAFREATRLPYAEALIAEMLEIWEEGHGVLSNHARIAALRKLLSHIEAEF